MDPNACLNAWYIAANKGDNETALDRWHDLKDWLDRGGFEPRWHAVERAEFMAWGERR
jgi:hypothetical protein